jgi:hypothetical protein
MRKRLDFGRLVSFAVCQRLYTQNMIDLSTTYNSLYERVFLDTTYS